MRFTGRAIGAAVVVTASLFASWGALAAPGAEIDGVVEGVATDGVGRVLLVFGSHLARLESFELQSGAYQTIAALPVTRRTRSVVFLALPPEQQFGDYVLAYSDRGRVGTARVRLTFGGVAPGAVTTMALSTELREELADARSMEGESLPLLHQASRLTGTLDTAQFSAYDDLAAESRIGTGASQVAAGNHDHDARYALHEHDHDDRYAPRAELAATTGAINSSDNPVDWRRLKNVPPGIADGTDDGATYQAGSGLVLAANAFSVSLSGSGAATSAARSDHNHTGTYLRLAGGDTATGKIQVSATGQAISATSGLTSESVGGIDCTASGGTAIAGHGDIGLLGDVDSGGDFGVWGRCSGAGQVGVLGTADSYAGLGVYGRNFGYLGVAVKGRTFCGTGVYGLAEEPIYGCYYNVGAVGVKAVASVGHGIALLAEARGSDGIGLLVNHTGGSGDVAVFQTDGTNCARIARDGTGYFNGGTYNSGADFAESVAVDAPAHEFEPGDVVAIDPASPRRFSLCRTPNSALVAGIVSTRPAVVGTVHDMAAEGREALAGEVRVGIVGIVPTKVCDEGGAIRIGDLLVTSSRPRMAMRAPDRPAPGTIIGKALGELGEGAGKVEVLMTAR